MYSAVMAHIVTAYIALSFPIMAYIVMAYVAMAYIVMAGLACRLVMQRALRVQVSADGLTHWCAPMNAACAQVRRACDYYFWQLFGACRLRALSDATLRFDLALGVRRRHAPKVAKNSPPPPLEPPSSIPATKYAPPAHKPRKASLWPLKKVEI